MLNPSKLAIGLEREGEEPIYRQLIRHIRAQIESGVLSAGTRLPASRDLAQQLNISRISVVNAYAELRAEGFLSAHAGRGTFIAGDANNTPQPADNQNGHSKIATQEAPTTPDRSLREMMRMARKLLQLSTDETIMIGDTMSTDILGAGSMGFTTVLTLSGVTQESDLGQFGYTPDFVIKSVKDLLDEELFSKVLDKQHDPVLYVA